MGQLRGIVTTTTHIIIMDHFSALKKFYCCILQPIYFCAWVSLNNHSIILRERDVAQSIACPPLKRSVVGSILLSGPSCSLGYFPFQPVVHNWFIKGRGMYCSVYGKVHIKDPLLLIEKSSLCGGSGFPSKTKSVST